jgi:hypothetical protein
VRGGTQGTLRGCDRGCGRGRGWSSGRVGKSRDGASMMDWLPGCAFVCREGVGRCRGASPGSLTTPLSMVDPEAGDALDLDDTSPPSRTIAVSPSEWLEASHGGVAVQWDSDLGLTPSRPQLLHTTTLAHHGIYLLEQADRRVHPFSASKHVGSLAPARYLCSPRMLGSEFVPLFPFSTSSPHRPSSTFHPPAILQSTSLHRR